MGLKESMINYRAKERMTQRTCADKCGISLQTWYSIENGYQKPSKVTEAKIRLLIDKKKEEE